MGSKALIFARLSRAAQWYSGAICVAGASMLGATPSMHLEVKGETPPFALLGYRRQPRNAWRNQEDSMNNAQKPHKRGKPNIRRVKRWLTRPSTIKMAFKMLKLIALVAKIINLIWG